MKNISKILALSLLTTTTAMAQALPDKMATQPGTTAPANTDIVSNTANGKSQTTIIDVNGNLKMIKPENPIPASAQIASTTTTHTETINGVVQANSVAPTQH